MRRSEIKDQRPFADIKLDSEKRETEKEGKAKDAPSGMGYGS